MDRPARTHDLADRLRHRHPQADPSHKPTTTPCPSPTAHQGVQAGGGGAFTDSVPAQVAGGLLMAGAVGAGAHRLLRLRVYRTRH